MILKNAAQALFSLLFIVTTVSPLLAHNGQVALVYPLESIIVDGDLSDWPDEVEFLPIRRVEEGDLLENQDDFSASFRIGYSTDKNAVFIAVEVVDDSPITGEKGDASWETQDGCEIFIDPMHHRDDKAPVQYYLRGITPGVFGAGKLTEVETARSQTDTSTIYEWRLDLSALRSEATTLHPGMTLGFDVSLWDNDEDGSRSWVTWGNSREKYIHSDRLGDLVLLASDAKVKQFTIDLQWQKDGHPIARSPVLIESLADSTLWILHHSDAYGRIDAILPPGQFRAEVLNLGQEASQHINFSIDANAHNEIRFPVKKAPLQPVPANAGKLHWQHFGIPDGLYSEKVVRLYLDRAGSPWFGTNGGGVSRFDGHRFTTYTENDGLASDLVANIFQERTGQMWFGSNTHELSLYDGKTFNRFDALKDAFPASPIMDIVEDSHSHFWMATSGNGAIRYDGKSFTHFTMEDGLSSNNLFAVFEDADQTLWFGSLGGGVNRYDGKNFTHFTTDDGLIHDFVYSVAQDHRGHMWFATIGGTSRWDGKTFTNFTTQDGLHSNRLTFILADSQHRVWFGSQDRGVSRWDGNAFTHFNRQNGLISNTVRRIMEDREGFFWFATPDKGISRYDGEFTTFDASNGLAHDQVYDIFEDSQGRLWFSTGGGLTLYDAETFTHFNTHHGLASNQLSTWPFSIAEDSRGYLYFATDSHGISRYDGEHFTTLDENDGLSGHRPTTLDVDGQGRVWIAAEKGISRYDDDVFTTFTTLDGLPDNAIGPISKDSKGHLWLGSMLKGISRYHGEMFTSLASPDGLEGSSILAFFDDSRGHMWISYMGKGVSRWDGEIFTTFSVEDGLAHNVVRSISEDTRGHMWFATSGGGISRYDGTVFQTLLATDGLADNAISRVLHRKNGETWIATSSGATRYRPNPTPPPIYLKNIVADRSYSALDSLRLPSSQKYLAFEFEGISFKTRPGQMAYLYRLKGYDDTWRQTRETQVEYSDLPVGRYTFEVKAVNRDLVYSQTPARVDVEVYYQPITSSIQIDDLVVQDLFVSFYKTYADLSIGSAHLSNNAPNAVEATLDFFVPDLMRRPSQQKFVLKPHSTQHVELYATLGEEILNLHSAKPLEAEVAVSCKIGEQTFSIEKTQTITVYGRGALTWDDLGRAAAFIIPEDESVSQFSRGLLENYRHLMAGRRVDGHIPKAMLLFEALNAHGIRYVSDASTPYAQVRGNASAVDNIQYPSELLESRMGDCDDCTVLYCSLLENLNISTALIDAPGHILMMFDAGVGEQRGYGFSLPNHLYIERDGRFWVPIEVTKLGEGSFLDAWELGAKTCQRLAASGGLRITDVHDAWSKYIYALPDATTEVALPIGETLKKSLLDNLRGLQQWRESFVDRTYVMPLLEDPLDNQRRLAFARTRLEAEYYNDAILQLSSLLNSPFKAEVLYLIGYSYAGQEDLSRAIRYIDQATQIAPDNYGYRRSLEILQAALD